MHFQVKRDYLFSSKMNGLEEKMLIRLYMHWKNNIIKSIKVLTSLSSSTVDSLLGVGKTLGVKLTLIEPI